MEKDQILKVQTDRIIEQYGISDSFINLNQSAIDFIIKEVLSKEDVIKTFLQKVGPAMAPKALIWKPQARNRYSADFNVSYKLYITNEDTKELIEILAHIDVGINPYNEKGDFKETMEYYARVKKFPPYVDEPIGEWKIIRKIMEPRSDEGRQKLDNKKVIFSLFKDIYCELKEMGYILPSEDKITVEEMVIRG